MATPDMSDDQKWAQEDDGFCKYCKPWHWPRKPMAIHFTHETAPHLWHCLEPIKIGPEPISRLSEVWMPHMGILYAIALSARKDAGDLVMCPCGAPEPSQRVLWTTDNPQLTFRDAFGRNTLTIASTRDDAPKTDTHGLYITNDTGKSLNVAVAGNIGPDAKITISDETRKKIAPEREPWMSQDEWARFQQGHML